MHTPTVFDSTILDTFKELQLTDEKLHHLKNVLRIKDCLLYTSPSPRDRVRSRMPSSA